MTTLSKDHFALITMVLLAYIGAAFTTGDIWPTYRFDMFSHPWPAATGHLMAQDTSGALHPVTDYSDWQCADAPSFHSSDRTPECSQYYANSTLSRRMLQHLETPGASGAEPSLPLSLVVRIRRFPDPTGPSTIVICPVTTCVAAATTAGATPP